MELQSNQMACREFHRTAPGWFSWLHFLLPTSFTARAFLVFLAFVVPISAFAKENSTFSHCQEYLSSSDPLAYELSVACVVQEKFGSIIESAAEIHEYDENLITAVIVVESRGNTNATSHRGAKGLMQLMPATAKSLGTTDIRDPLENILSGTKYLRQLENRYGFQSVEEALLAYNMGPSRAEDWLETSGRPARDASYVRKVMGIYERLMEEERRKALTIQEEETNKFLTSFVLHIAQLIGKRPPELLSSRRIEVETKEE